MAQTKDTHTSTETLSSEAHETNTHATTEHYGPHIPGTQGEKIDGLFLGDTAISNTILSTWIFMAFLFIFVGVLYTAIKTNLFPKVRAFGVDVVGKFDTFLTDALGEKRVARKFLPLV